jgi:hypothetical protein
MIDPGSRLTAIFIYEYYWQAQITEFATWTNSAHGREKKLWKMLNLQVYCADMTCWANSCRSLDVLWQIIVPSARSARPWWNLFTQQHSSVSWNLNILQHSYHDIKPPIFQSLSRKACRKGNAEISSSTNKVSVFDSKQEKETVLLGIVSNWLWVHPSITSNGMARLFAR